MRRGIDQARARLLDQNVRAVVTDDLVALPRASADLLGKDLGRLRDSLAEAGEAMRHLHDADQVPSMAYNAWRDLLEDGEALLAAWQDVLAGREPANSAAEPDNDDGDV